MPRDQKGHPFGIGSRVRSLIEPHVEFTVTGFLVLNGPISREKLEAIAETAAYAKEPNVRYWHEVEVVNPEKDHYKEFSDHTDLCYMDVAQKGGLEVPVERGKVQLLALAAEADKAVWGP